MGGCNNGLGIWGLSLRPLVGTSLVGGSPAHWLELGYSGLGRAWLVAVPVQQPDPIVDACNIVVKRRVGERFGDGNGFFDRTRRDAIGLLGLGSESKHARLGRFFGGSSTPKLLGLVGHCIFDVTRDGLGGCHGESIRFAPRRWFLRRLDDGLFWNPCFGDFWVSFLGAGELGGPFVDEGIHSFFLVGTGKEHVEIFAFEFQALA